MHLLQCDINVLLQFLQLAERDHNREVCNNNLLHALMHNKTFKVQPGDWIGHTISNNS